MLDFTIPIIHLQANNPVKKAATNPRVRGPKFIASERIFPSIRSFDTLPKKLKEALGRKGKGGQESAGLHFLGYIKEDGSITGDINV